MIDKKDSLKKLEIVQEILFNNQSKTNKTLENTTQKVLVENRTDDKTRLFGRSEYMTPVKFDGKKSDIGKVVPVEIKRSNRSTLFGEVINNLNQRVA